MAVRRRRKFVEVAAGGGTVNTSIPFSYGISDFRSMGTLAGQIVDEFTACGVNTDLAHGVLHGVISLLTQGVASIAWPGGNVETIGANVFAISPSGSGKTLVFKTLMAPIHDFLNEHASELCFRPLIEDATRQALPLQLSENRFGWLATDEAGQILPLIEAGAPLLAKLLDATPMQRARVSTGYLQLGGYSFTAMFLGQKSVFDSLCPTIRRTGGIGAINRFFLVQGAAMLPMPPNTTFTLNEATKKAFSTVVNKLMCQSALNAANPAFKLPVMQLVREAAEYVSMLARDSHVLRGPYSGAAESGYLAEYRARHAQRVLRLAGALHAFEHGVDGDIELKTVLGADHYGRQSIVTYDRLTYQPPKPTQTQVDAQTLLKALQQLSNSTGSQRFPIANLRRGAPTIGLTKGRFDKAVAELGAAAVIQILVGERSDVLQLTPSLWRLKHLDF